MVSQIPPILTSLKRHLIPCTLIVFEIAFTCAVLCNAISLMGKSLKDLNAPNALAEDALTVVVIKGADPRLATSDVPRNLSALKSISGVRSAAAMNSVPFSGNSWISGLSSTPPGTEQRPLDASTYLLTEGGESALGLLILKGRDFNDGDYANAQIDENHSSTASVVLVSERYAQRMWPNQSSLGKALYLGDHQYEVIGVVANVLSPIVSDGEGEGNYATVFFPSEPTPGMFYYVVRSNHSAVDSITNYAGDVLAKLNPVSVVQAKTFMSMRNDHFDTQRNMAWTLAIVCMVMLAITGFGIIGLTSFWVHQRRRQIGVRRALGASRSQILAYFRFENFIIVTVGIVLGMCLAYGLNIYFSQYYELGLLAWYYLPMAAFLLWGIGQVAVLVPAYRASKISPVAAMYGA